MIIKGKDSWKIQSSLFKRINNFLSKGSIRPGYWLYRIKWNLLPKYFIVSRFPTDLIIESSGACNLSCKMCFQPFLKDKRAIMDFSLFRKILDEAAFYNLNSLKLSWRGEPLLNPRFQEMIRYSKQKGIKEVSFLTNASLLDKDTAKAILDAGPDQVIFSVDGLTKNSYEDIRSGADFGIVMDNIKNFLSVAKLNRRRPFVRVQIVRYGQPESEINSFIDYWKHQVDEVAVISYVDYSYLQDNSLPNREHVIGRLPCTSLWQRLAVMHDGSVTVCCHDVSARLIIGNLKDSSIKELWHSKKLNQLRSIHKRKDLDSIGMCQLCRFPETYLFDGPSRLSEVKKSEEHEDRQEIYRR